VLYGREALLEPCRRGRAAAHDPAVSFRGTVYNELLTVELAPRTSPASFGGREYLRRSAGPHRGAEQALLATPGATAADRTTDLGTHRRRLPSCRSPSSACTRTTRTISSGRRNPHRTHCAIGMLLRRTPLRAPRSPLNTRAEWTASSTLAGAREISLMDSRICTRRDPDHNAAREFRRCPGPVRRRLQPACGTADAVVKLDATASAMRVPGTAAPSRSPPLAAQRRRDAPYPRPAAVHQHAQRRPATDAMGPGRTRQLAGVRLLLFRPREVPSLCCTRGRRLHAKRACRQSDDDRVSVYRSTRACQR